jgi:hypothetical protein
MAQIAPTNTPLPPATTVPITPSTNNPYWKINQNKSNSSDTETRHIRLPDPNNFHSIQNNNITTNLQPNTSPTILGTQYHNPPAKAPTSLQTIPHTNPTPPPQTPTGYTPALNTVFHNHISNPQSGWYQHLNTPMTPTNSNPSVDPGSVSVVLNSIYNANPSDYFNSKSSSKLNKRNLFINLPPSQKLLLCRIAATSAPSQDPTHTDPSCFSLSNIGSVSKAPRHLLTSIRLSGAGESWQHGHLTIMMYHGLLWPSKTESEGLTFFAIITSAKYCTRARQKDIRALITPNHKNNLDDDDIEYMSKK